MTNQSPLPDAPGVIDMGRGWEGRGGERCVWNDDGEWRGMSGGGRRGGGGGGGGGGLLGGGGVDCSGYNHNLDINLTLQEESKLFPETSSPSLTH
ncbi:unnamed protein product [Dicrocoelium dendriticum]|nr:unnamed protein product [Dicrocoelium dendriticum]